MGMNARFVTPDYGTADAACTGYPSDMYTNVRSGSALILLRSLVEYFEVLDACYYSQIFVMQCRSLVVTPTYTVYTVRIKESFTSRSQMFDYRSSAG